MRAYYIIPTPRRVQYMRELNEHIKLYLWAHKTEISRGLVYAPMKFMTLAH